MYVAKPPKKPAAAGPEMVFKYWPNDTFSCTINVTPAALPIAVLKKHERKEEMWKWTQHKQEKKSVNWIHLTPAKSANPGMFGQDAHSMLPPVPAANAISCQVAASIGT